MSMDDPRPTTPLCLGDKRYGDKVACLADLATRAATETSVGRAEILDGLTRREALGSTGVGGGIALPHARVAGIVEPFVMLVRLKQALDFQAVDEKPVDLVCLLLLPVGEDGASLGLLSRCARCLRDPATLTALRRAKGEDGFAEAVAAAWRTGV